MFCSKVVSPAITSLSFSPLLGSFFCLNRLGFYGCGTRLPEQLHTTAFPANYTFAERKNLQEIHFKPVNQARQQTFASDKTKRKWQERGRKSSEWNGYKGIGSDRV